MSASRVSKHPCTSPTMIKVHSELYPGSTHGLWHQVIHGGFPGVQSSRIASSPGILATIIIEELTGLLPSEGRDETSDRLHALACCKWRIRTAHIGLDPAGIDDHRNDAAICKVNGNGSHHHVHRRFRGSIRD